MKKSKLALSVALGMSLLGSAVANLPASAADAQSGLFQVKEVSAPILIAEKTAAEHKCGAGSCGGSAAKAKDKQCGGKDKGKDKHCGSGHCGSKEKGKDKHCGSGHCGSKEKGKQ